MRILSFQKHNLKVGCEACVLGHMVEHLVLCASDCVADHTANGHYTISTPFLHVNSMKSCDFENLGPNLRFIWSFEYRICGFYVPYIHFTVNMLISLASQIPTKYFHFDVLGPDSPTKFLSDTNLA